MLIHLTHPTVERAEPGVIAIPTHGEIAERAFWLYEGRGETDGRDLDDWLEAERQLLHERMQASVAE